MIPRSSASNNSTTWVATPALKVSAKAILERRISKSNCGMMTGNPSIAISEACCMAFEAMAASMVKTRLKPVPPRKLIPMNCQMLRGRISHKSDEQDQVQAVQDGHQQNIIEQFGQHKFRRMGDGIKIEHPAPAFL